LRTRFRLYSRTGTVVRILVVEDSPLDQALLRHLLDRPEWNVEIAEHGREALDSIAASQPDLVITDLQMPVMGGLELVREIRQTNSLLPVVLVAGKGSEETTIEALRCGATTYSPKSMLNSDLVRTVEQVLMLSQRMCYSHSETFFPEPSTRVFVLDNQLGQIGPLIENLQNSLPSWSNRDRLQIGMALDEALVNAMHHGNLEVESVLKRVDEVDYYNLIEKRLAEEPYCSRRVNIEVEYSDEHICIQVSDEGPGFDPAGIPDPTAPENLHQISGRGIFLIRNFMDQVAHNRVGNQITMTKLRKGCMGVDP